MLNSVKLIYRKYAPQTISPSTILNNVVRQKEISCDYYVYTKFSCDYVNSKTVLTGLEKHKAEPRTVKQFPLLYDDGDETSHLSRKAQLESNKAHVKNTKSRESV